MRDQIAPSKYQPFVYEKRQSNVLHFFFCIFSVGKFCYYYYNIIWIKYNIPGLRRNSFELFVLSKKKKFDVLCSENLKLISTECHSFHCCLTLDGRWTIEQWWSDMCFDRARVTKFAIRSFTKKKKTKIAIFLSPHAPIQFNQFIGAHNWFGKKLICSGSMVGFASKALI